MSTQNATGSTKIDIHIDNLSQAVSVINQAGKSKKIEKMNKSLHYGEIIRYANKLLNQQTANSGSQS